MTKYVVNGGIGDDVIQNASWTVEDLIISNMGGGNDTFKGWSAAYDVNGEEGNDTIQSGFMGGTAHGGAGDDTIWTQAGGGSNEAFGDDGDDFLWTWGGTGVANTLSGGSGVDWLKDTHIGGVDQLNGGSGYDFVDFRGNADALLVDLGIGEAKNGAAEFDEFDSIEGLIGGNGGDTLIGDDGGNVLMGASGADVLSGTGGNDLLIGAEIAQIIQGFTNTRGHNYLNPYSITDTQATVYGIVSISDDGAVDLLEGGSGNDVLLGGLGADELFGSSGKDTASYTDSSAGVTVDLGAGTATGGTAEGDTFNLIENLTGSTSADSLTGSSKRNLLRGHDGDDAINGGKGDDTLKGEKGADQLNGGKGVDKLSGGSESDAFIFDSALDLANADVITDFAVDVDFIHLDNGVFRALRTEGALAADAFFIGAAAATKQHRIIYNDATGELSYDHDGKKIDAPVLFATLQPGLAIEASDFKVV